MFRPHARVIGDQPVRADGTNVAALKLVAEDGQVGRGSSTLFRPRPAQDQIIMVLEE